MTLMNPGPATSSVALPARSAAATTSSATSRGLRPSCLASASAPLACASARSLGRTTGSTPSVGTGDRGERRCQQFGDDDEGISHEESIVLVYVFVRHAGFAGPWRDGRGVRRYPRWHPALVAQGIEHRFPEPCVACSNHAEGAPSKLRSDDHAGSSEIAVA